MAILVRGKNIEVTPALREYVENQAMKLTRYFDTEMNVQAMLSVEHEAQKIEVTCYVDSIVLRAVESNRDMYASIDIVFDKIIRQIHKHKTRLAKKLRQTNFVEEFKSIEPIKEEEFEIIRRKSFVARPMDVEDAILQMNLIGHDFFVFFNDETESINVVYRRHNGKYGLIQPEY